MSTTLDATPSPQSPEQQPKKRWPLWVKILLGVWAALWGIGIIAGIIVAVVSSTTTNTTTNTQYVPVPQYVQQAPSNPCHRDVFGYVSCTP